MIRASEWDEPSDIKTKNLCKCIFDKRFLPSLHLKNLSQINNKKMNNPRKTGKRFEQTFQKVNRPINI